MRMVLCINLEIVFLKSKYDTSLSLEKNILVPYAGKRLTVFASMIFMDSFFPNTDYNAIVATLCFFDLFDQPLTKAQIEQYLLGKRLSADSIDQVLRENSEIGQKESYYFLTGREQLVVLRQKRETDRLKRLAQCKHIIPWLRHLPFVKGVFICNNLAFDVATPEGDIDLFIVTEETHLLLGRLLTTMLFQVLGIRRHGRKIRDRFCLSFYCTETSLEFEKIALSPQDIYLAYWARTLIPLYDKGIREHIDTQNRSWLGAYFPDMQRLQRKKIESNPSKIRKMLEYFFLSPVGKPLERLIDRLQMKRLLAKYDRLPDKSGTVISENMLKFHNEDRREYYQREWLKQIDRFIKNDQKN